MRSIPWQKLPVSLTELCLDTTLRCGQSFRWRKSEEEIWSCALHGRILSLRQDSTHLHYQATYSDNVAPVPLPPPSPLRTAFKRSSEDDDTEELVAHYLNLQPDLTQLYEQWSQADTNFRKKAPKFTGVRILKQDAWEALLGFICSSNNNIIRISQMMEKLCIHYGALIGHIDSRPYHDMPSPSALIGPGVEAHLRKLGFGYRAKYLHQTALIVNEKGLPWLNALRNPESPILGAKPSHAGEMQPGGREGYRNAHEELLALQGVGPKVADCVCLMGLGWGEAVPIDTHVWQIAQRDYKFGKGKHASLTKDTYDAIANKFRSLWGKEAGWAHSVLFTADLRAFTERLKAKVERVEVRDESDGEKTVVTETEVNAQLLTPVSIKRKLDHEEPSVKLESVSMARTTKKRRKAR